MTSISLREQSISLRKKGYSYGMIAEQLGIAKSTMNDWLHNIPYNPSPAVQKRIKLAHIRAGQYHQASRMRNVEAARLRSKKDIGLITKRDLLMFGLGLYLGEGSKAYESVVIVNADPRVIRLAIAWFRITYGLSTKNFTLTIHMYPDNEVDETHSFWLKQTGLPAKQLRKTQIDRRENKLPIKHGKFPYGTAHLRIVASGNKRFGKSLHRQIMTSIDTIT